MTIVVTEEAPPGNITTIATFDDPALLDAFLKGQPGRPLFVNDGTTTSHVVSDGNTISPVPATPKV